MSKAVKTTKLNEVDILTYKIELLEQKIQLQDKRIELLEKSELMNNMLTQKNNKQPSYPTPEEDKSPSVKAETSHKEKDNSINSKPLDLVLSLARRRTLT